MELPDLGKHCKFTGCNQLDFLSYTCCHCKDVFCQDHYKLADHHCPVMEDPSFDVRVPVCPICKQPVPCPRDEDPNIRVNQHIQNNCSEPQKKKNGCRRRGCNAKLLVPMTCDECRQDFCVKHRLGQDHECQGPIKPVKKPETSNGKRSGLSTIRNAASQAAHHHHRSSPQRRQEIAQLQKKERLTEEEQVKLATLLSLEQRHGNGKNCIVC